MGWFGNGHAALNTPSGGVWCGDRGTPISNPIPEANDFSYVYGGFVFEPDELPVNNIVYVTCSPHSRHGAEVLISYDNHAGTVLKIWDWNPNVHAFVNVDDLEDTDDNYPTSADLNDPYFDKYKLTTTWGGGSRFFMWFYNRSVRVSGDTWYNDFWLWNHAATTPAWEQQWQSANYIKNPSVDEWPNGHSFWLAGLETFGGTCGTETPYPANWGDKKTGFWNVQYHVDGTTHLPQLASNNNFGYQTDNPGSNIKITDSYRGTSTGPYWISQAYS